MQCGVVGCSVGWWDAVRGGGVQCGVGWGVVGYTEIMAIWYTLAKGFHNDSDTSVTGQ